MLLRHAILEAPDSLQQGIRTGNEVLISGVKYVAISLNEHGKNLKKARL